MVENDNDRRALAAREEKIADEVLGLICEVCDDDAVRDERDLDLFEAGFLDSLAAIELLVGIEERFGVDIAPTAMERSEMNTPNKIIYQIAVRL